MNQETGLRGFRRRGVWTTAAAQASWALAPRSEPPSACILAPPWLVWGRPAKPAQLRRRWKMVEDGAEELEDLVHFSVSELPSRGYGVMEEIRRQGKLCDVTLKVPRGLGAEEEKGRVEGSPRPGDRAEGLARDPHAGRRGLWREAAWGPSGRGRGAASKAFRKGRLGVREWETVGCARLPRLSPGAARVPVC